jgi:CRP-like cAMP-binding protein
MRPGRLFLATFSEGDRDRLRRLAHEVAFPAGARIFNEGRPADRFWVIHNGLVALDMHVPSRAAVVVETLSSGELLGWSWMLPPYRWHLGAVAQTHVTADEFDAATLRVLCDEDPVFGRDMTFAVASVIAERLHASRTRLLDLYRPPAPASDD